MERIDFVTAGEAAALLGVSRPTLYAYVSRGLVRSEPHGNGRQRRYARADIDRLISRRQGAGGPGTESAQTAETVLLPSAITLIAEGSLYYRGHDAVALADAVGLEEVARILWQCDGFDPFPDAAARLAALPGATVPPAPGMAELAPLARLLASLPGCEAADPQAVNHGRQGCARTGARLLYHALDTLVPPPEGSQGMSRPPIQRSLAHRWMGPAPAEDVCDLLRRALVLCADHEFNPSTFAARCVAGTGTSVYGAVCAALSALQGPRHGGATGRIAAFLARLEIDLRAMRGSASPSGPAGDAGDAGPPAGSARELEAMVAAHLARGEELPGFGHPLYPAGDPRARALMRAIARARPDDPQGRFLDGICGAAMSLTDQAPNIDFALVALARVLGLPQAAPITLFALGRIVGWVAHVEEQYRDGRLVRPRAAYTGPLPR